MYPLAKFAVSGPHGVLKDTELFPKYKVRTADPLEKVGFFVSQQSGKKRGVVRHLAWHLSSVPSKVKVS